MPRSVIRALRTALILLLVMLAAGASALADSIEVKLNESTKVFQSASTSARYVKVPKGLRVTLKAYHKFASSVLVSCSCFPLWCSSS